MSEWIDWLRNLQASTGPMNMAFALIGLYALSLLPVVAFKMWRKRKGKPQEKPSGDKWQSPGDVRRTGLLR